MATLSNNNRYLVTVAGVALVAVAPYSIGRVYPPLGPTAGTITPADRYVASQVGEGDVTLGDTSVPQLMQTDAFEVISKNPDFRHMAGDPGFAALLQNGPAMAAVAANPQAFTAAAKDPQLFAQMAASAAGARSRMAEMAPQSAAMYASIASHAQTFSYMADKHPQAMLSLMANAA